MTASERKIRAILEAIVRIRGGRGYSAGHPIPKNNPKPGLGKSEYDIEEDTQTQQTDPVEVSRAFRPKEK